MSDMMKKVRLVSLKRGYESLKTKKVRIVDQIAELTDYCFINGSNLKRE